MDDADTPPLTDLQPFNGSRLPVAKVFRACASCEFGVKEGTDRVCRYNPPQQNYIALPQMMPGKLGAPPQQGLAIQPFSGFPIVRDDQFCGRYEARGQR